MNERLDMAQFIEARSDQLNADDLIGRNLTITVTKVTGSDGDQPISIHYQGDNGKPFKPCKTIRRVLVAIWGRYADDYVGRSMTLYRDDKVTFGGLDVGGIRISHMSHIDKDTVVVVAKSKGKKAGMKIQPLQPGQAKDDKSAADPAANWTTTFIAKVEAAATIADVEALETGQAKRLTELHEKRPELRKQIAGAVTGRKTALSPADDDDWGEGPADTDRGEAFATDDDQPLAAKTAASIIAQFKAATDKQGYMVALAEWNKHKSGIEAHDEALAGDVFTAEQVAKQRLGVE